MSMSKPLMIPVLALAASCGGSADNQPRATLTAEQLNSVARPAPEDDSLGAPQGQSTAAPSTSPDEPPPPPPAARLRVIHASPDRAAASVDVYLDDMATAGVSALAFRGVAGALEVPAGEHAVHLRRAGAATSVAPTLTAHTPGLTASGHYTAIAHGLTNAAPRLALTVGQDQTTPPDAGHARIRLFHALVGLGAVDVCLPGAVARPAAAGHPAVAATPPTALVTNMAYGAFGQGSDGGYVDVPAGTAVTVQLRAHAARACTGAALGGATLTAPDRGLVTVVAVGRVGGAPPAPKQLLVCPEGGDGAPSCTAVAVR